MRKLIVLAVLLMPAGALARRAPPTGPIVETCAFLPASDPCHYPPRPPICVDERGVLTTDCPF